MTDTPEPVEAGDAPALIAPAATMNVYQRMRAVMVEIGYVRKDKKVDGFGGGYMAVTHDNVTAHVRPVMLKYGLLAIPRDMEFTALQSEETSKGATIHIVRVSLNTRFQNIDDPSDYVDVPSFADGKDAGDKAPGKGISMAVKYGLLKGLMLETGTDEESRIDSRPRNPVKTDPPPVQSRPRQGANEPRVKTVPGVGNGDPLFIPVGKKHYANGAAYDDWTGWKKALADAAKAALQMPDAKDALDELFAANEDSVEAFGKAPEGTDGGMRGFISWREGIYARVEQPETEAAE